MVAKLHLPDFDPLQVFSESLADEGGPIDASPACDTIGRMQQFFIKDDLNRCHMWTIFHNELNSQPASLGVMPRPLV